VTDKSKSVLVKEKKNCIQVVGGGSGGVKDRKNSAERGGEFSTRRFYDTAAAPWIEKMAGVWVGRGQGEGEKIKIPLRKEREEGTQIWGKKAGPKGPEVKPEKKWRIKQK